MGSAYPELIQAAKRIEDVVMQEEHQFHHQVTPALNRLEPELKSIEQAREQLGEQEFAALFKQQVIGLQWLRRDVAEFAGKKLTMLAKELPATIPSGSIYYSITPEAMEQYQLPADWVSYVCSVANINHFKYLDSENRSFPQSFLIGEKAFRLYDTFGLPLDFIVDAGRDRNVYVDLDGYEASLNLTREVAKLSWKGGSQKSANPLYIRAPQNRVRRLLRPPPRRSPRPRLHQRTDQGVQTLAPGEEGEVILDATSFYADSGGQQGDIGHLLGARPPHPVPEVPAQPSPSRASSPTKSSPSNTSPSTTNSTP